MSDLNRIEANNAELRECIEIAESLPDAPVTVDGWDIATMQKFIDNRGSLDYLYNYQFNSRTPSKNMFKWLELVDLSHINSAKNLFYYCTNLTDEDVPKMDISHIGYITDMFYACSKLTKIPSLDFSKAKSVDGIFRGCYSIKTVGDLDFSGVTNGIQTVFYECTGLVSVGSINTVSTTSLHYNNVFYGCTSLVSVGLIDVRNVTFISNIVSKCKALTDITIKNIKANLTVGSGDGSSSSHYGHLLTVDSLVGLCYELRDTGSVKTLTIGSANLEKLASVYVRSIEITDAMRAEDDLIDEKLPFERCESTDEGATLIGDYILAKNWKLA